MRTLKTLVWLVLLQLPFAAAGESDYFVGLKDGRVLTSEGRTMEAGSDLRGLAVSADGTRLVATSGEESRLYVFDVQSGRELARIPVGRGSNGVGIDPTGRLAVVANGDDGTISLVDLSSLRLRAEVDVGREPRQVAFSPAGDRAYVSLLGDDAVAEVDLSNLERVGVLPVEGAYGIDIAPQGKTLFVSSTDDQALSVFDLVAGRELQRIAISAPNSAVDVLPDGQRVLAGGAAAETVDVIDIRLRQRVAQVDIGSPVHDLNAAANGRIFFVAAQGGVIAIAFDSLRVVAKQRLPAAAVAVAVPGNP